MREGTRVSSLVEYWTLAEIALSAYDYFLTVSRLAPSNGGKSRGRTEDRSLEKRGCWRGGDIPKIRKRFKISFIFIGVNRKKPTSIY
jgi:hypothetical protein